MSVQWISHRGESYDAPQNTVPAFRLSLERKTDGMECDVRFTRDRRMVVCHDPSTCATCDACAEIARLTYDQLQQINVVFRKGGFKGTHIPLFADTLPYLGDGRVYYVEIKENDPGLLEEVRRTVAEAGIPWSQIVIISFIEDMVAQSKSVMPEVRTLFLTEGTDAEALIAKLRNLHADGVDFHASSEFLTPDYVSQVKKAGFMFAVWTVDDVEKAKYCISCGVDAITSNRAAWLRDQLAEQQHTLS